MALLVPLATQTFRDETLYIHPLLPENATSGRPSGISRSTRRGKSADGCSSKPIGSLQLISTPLCCGRVRRVTVKLLPRKAFRQSVWVCCGRRNKIPQIGWLGTTELCSLMIPKARSTNSKCQWGWFPQMGKCVPCPIVNLIISVWHSPGRWPGSPKKLCLAHAALPVLSTSDRPSRNTAK